MNDVESNYEVYLKFRLQIHQLEQIDLKSISRQRQNNFISE